jgi:predicted neuraminidase
MQETEPALRPVAFNLQPGPQYHSNTRLWQGIPGLERTATGRLYATWYTGGRDEGPDNYVLVIRSDDDGRNWSEPVLVIDPPGRGRAYDPCLWLDPRGRLWLFWAQSEDWFDGRAGVWASVCDAPEAGDLAWSQPRRLDHGVMMNKPTALTSGEWLLPVALWARSALMSAGVGEQFPHPELASERHPRVFVSTDEGESFALLGQAEVPERSFDEHMIVERRDGSLWMLVRTLYGIGESLSTDRGKTWSPGRDSGLGGPDSRFFIRRLHSGRLLLVNHHKFTGRNNLTAMLSEDDGHTWPARLLLDARDAVSYPDGLQASDGAIFVIYDHDRQGAKEILMAVFTEADILAGTPVSAACRLQQLVNKAGSAL